MKKKPTLALLLFAAAPAAVFAQTAPQPQAQRQQAPRGMDPRQLIDAATQVIQAIEANQAGPIWDTSSPAMKAVTTRAQFISAMQQRNATNGILANREWYSIARTRAAPGTKVPQGDYFTVGFVGNTQAGLVLRSTVSFHLDTDSTWRLIGYAM